MMLKQYYIIILICFFVVNSYGFANKNTSTPNHTFTKNSEEKPTWENSRKLIGQTKLDIINTERKKQLGYQKGCRKFPVVVYYPAYSIENCKNADYDSVYRPKEKEMFSIDNSIHKYSKYTLSYLNKPTNTYIDAKPFPYQKFPVVIFSPGSGINQRLYQNFYWTLVNAGYIVVGVNHSYDADHCVLTNGKILDNSFMARKRNSSLSSAEALFAKERICDINDTVNQIKQWNKNSKLLAGIFDVSRIGIAGHSFGGKIALVINKINKNVKAAVIFDGIFNNVIVNNKDYTKNSKQIKNAYIQNKPFLLFLSSDMYQKGQLGKTWKFNKNVYKTLLTKSKPPFYCIYINEAGHMSYTDLGYLLSKPEYKHFFGKNLPQNFYSAVYNASINFLDVYLKGEKNELKEFEKSLAKACLKISNKGTNKLNTKP